MIQIQGYSSNKLIFLCRDEVQIPPENFNPVAYPLKREIKADFINDDILPNQNPEVSEREGNTK